MKSVLIATTWRKWRTGVDRQKKTSDKFLMKITLRYMKTDKTHNRIIEHKDKTINDYLSKILKLEKETEELKEEIKEAKDLKIILDRFSSLTINGMGFSVSGGNWETKLTLPDTVLQYTEDILGGKVIKQEGTRCLVIGKDGTVNTGLTKEKADKGYGYKLVRS